MARRNREKKKVEQAELHETVKRQATKMKELEKRIVELTVEKERKK